MENKIKELIKLAREMSFVTKNHQTLYFYTHLDLSKLILNKESLFDVVHNEEEDFYLDVVYYDYKHLNLYIEDVRGLSSSELVDEASFLLKLINNFINIDLPLIKLITPSTEYDIKE